MAEKWKTPEPLGGGDRGLELIKAGSFDGSKLTPPFVRNQGHFPPGLDPNCHCLIGEHWFGVRPDGRGGWCRIGGAHTRAMWAA